MMVAMNWKLAFPKTFAELMRLCSALNLTPRKMSTHYALWIDLPRCNL